MTLVLLSLVDTCVYCFHRPPNPGFLPPSCKALPGFTQRPRRIVRLPVSPMERFKEVSRILVVDLPQGPNHGSGASCQEGPSQSSHALSPHSGDTLAGR